jgi:putative FmdB family regulatory protein
MPIYEYRCSSCGTQKDVMQKISDPPLTTCPECGKETFSKQLSAAGFQLKGSGYYATDFKGGSKSERKPESTPESTPESKCETAPCATCPAAGNNT